MPNDNRVNLVVGKVNPCGKRVWATEISGSPPREALYGLTIALDHRGGVCIAGSVQYPSPIETGLLPDEVAGTAGTPDVDAADSTNTFHALVARLTTAGEVCWVKRWEDSAFEQAVGIATDSCGYIYVSGLHRFYFGVIRKYDLCGALVRELPVDFVRGPDIGFDARGWLYAAGYGIGGRGLHLLKLNQNLEIQNTHLENVPDVSTHGSAMSVNDWGEIVICGSHDQPFHGQIPNGPSDAYVIKYTAH